MTQTPDSGITTSLSPMEQPMQITVNLFATFREGRFDTASQGYPEGTAVRGVVAELRIPERELGIVLVNGRHAEMGHRPAAPACWRPP